MKKEVMKDVINWKKMFDALYNASKMGIYITEQDGHYWINCGEIDGNNYISMLEENGIVVNNKIYEGPLQALAVIDKTIKMAGYEKGLFFEIEFYGEPVVDESRIDKVERGKGGLV